jgi:hypothetical protein
VVLTRNKDGKLIFDLSHYEHEERIVAPATPIRKRRSMNCEGSVMLRGRTPAPAATRTAEYSPRKRRRDEFQMPPACRMVGAELKFPLAGDVISREPKKIIKCRVTNRGMSRRRSAASRKRLKGGLLKDWKRGVSEVK